jgi:hypothetical protein
MELKVEGKEAVADKLAISTQGRTRARAPTSEF